MNRTQVISLVVVLLIAAFVVYLSTRERQPPVLPLDEEHAGMFVLEQCMECHGPDGGYPKSRNHPLGDDCLRCHGRP